MKYFYHVHKHFNGFIVICRVYRSKFYNVQQKSIIRHFCIRWELRFRFFIALISYIKNFETAKVTVTQQQRIYNVTDKDIIFSTIHDIWFSS